MNRAAMELKSQINNPLHPAFNMIWFTLLFCDLKRSTLL